MWAQNGDYAMRIDSKNRFSAAAKGYALVLIADVLATTQKLDPPPQIDKFGLAKCVPSRDWGFGCVGVIVVASVLVDVWQL